MDRLDAMQAFVIIVDRASLSAAARELGCSIAAISRAVSSLEERLGASLLHRTTRALRLTDRGTRYLAVCRRVLAELSIAERAGDDAVTTPQGLLTVTAPSMFGALHVRPVVDAYLEAHEGVHVRLVLLDRVVNVIDEGIDIAVRIAHLPDSALIATTVGFVRRVVCASPRYLASKGPLREPSDLASHRCIGFSALTPGDSWTFSAGPRGGRARHVKVRPVLMVNTAEAAIGSAVAGQGVTTALSYQVESALASGALTLVLEAFAPEPVPVQLVYPASRTDSAKVRAFVELAAPRLRKVLADRVRRTTPAARPPPRARRT